MDDEDDTVEEVKDSPPAELDNSDDGIMGELHPTNWIMAAGYFEKERGTVIKGDPRSDHQDRFFVLTRMALVWFKRPTDADLLGEEKGKLYLKDLQYCEITRGSGDLKTIMRLTTGSKSISLRCANAAYAELWASTIKKAQDGSDIPELDTPVEKATGIIAMGYLEKSRDGAVRTGWCTRFFVLTSRFLYYFKCTDPSYELFGEERSRFSNREMIEIKVRDGDPSIVDITLQRKVKSDRVVEVRATSPGLAAEWVRHLTKAAESARVHGTPGHHSTPGGILDSMNNRLKGLKRGSIIEGLAGDMKSLLPVTRLHSDSDVSKGDASPSPSHSRAGSFSPTADDAVGGASAGGDASTDTAAATAAGSGAKAKKAAKKKPAAGNNAVLYTGLCLLALNVLAYTFRVGGWLLGSCALMLLNAMVGYLLMQTPLWAPPPPPVRKPRLKAVAQKPAEVTSPGGSVTAPVAGKTAMGASLKVVAPAAADADVTVDSGEQMSGGDAPGTYFNLRIGPNYKKFGKKAPSAPAMYEFIGADLLDAPDNVDHVGEQMALPLGYDKDDPAIQGVFPKLLIVNAQLPFDHPSAFKKATRGSGASLIMYFKVKPETQKWAGDLNGADTPNAVRLLNRYFSEAVHGGQHPSLSFKAICHVLNIKELGLPSMIEGYNGKPVLIKVTGCTYRTEEYFEVDVNAHRFGFVTRTAIANLKQRIKDMEIRAGFTIEGKTDEELPERLLAGADLHHIDIEDGLDFP